MRKYALLAALAGAIFATAVALPNRADAAMFVIPPGRLSAAVTLDAAQAEQVRWCGWRGCFGRYYSRPYNYGYHRPWEYYAYYSYGWDWPRCLQVALLHC